MNQDGMRGDGPTYPGMRVNRDADPLAHCPLERDHIMLSAATVARIEAAVANGIEQTVERIENSVSEGIAKGVKRAVTLELAATLWGVFFTMLRAKAKNEAGGWLIGKIMLLFKGAGYLVAMFAVVYAVGGWPFVYATGKALLTRLPTP